MSWTADEEGLEQLKKIFKGTLSSVNEERKLADKALESINDDPNVEIYLFNILVLDETAKSDIRAAAGIKLKNIILTKTFKNNHHVNQIRNINFLMENIFEGLTSKNYIVRNVTGNVITALFSSYGFEKCKNVISRLIQIVNYTYEDGSQIVQESAMMTLSKICEDSMSPIEKKNIDQKTIEFLIFNFLKFINYFDNSKIKSLSLSCINKIGFINLQHFIDLDDYLHLLFKLFDNTDNEIRKNLCSSFLLIFDVKPISLKPYLNEIIDYNLKLIQTASEDISLEACEFLLTLASNINSESDKIFFRSKLNVLLPTILDKMIFSHDEIFVMSHEGKKNKFNTLDDDDGKFYLSKPKENNSDFLKRSDYKNGSNCFMIHTDDSDTESDFYYTYPDNDASDHYNWNLRKCSAATLDMLSLNMPDEVLKIVSPILQDKIQSSDWPIRESAILAFGAISKSFINLSNHNLPNLISFLENRLQDDQPKVKQITCWTLSRFSSWIAEEANNNTPNAKFFQSIFLTIIDCALDNKKIVQESACSALSSFVEDLNLNVLTFYIKNLFDFFTKSFRIFQHKNLLILYDFFQTLVEKFGYNFFRSNLNYVEPLLSPLLEKWNSLENNDTDLWILLECMGTVASTLKDLFAPYAVSVYERAIEILSIYTKMEDDSKNNFYKEDFIITSIDLINGLIQGFEYHSAELIHQNKIDLCSLMITCFHDSNFEIKQSAYALLGDLAIFTFSTIKPFLGTIFFCITNEIKNRDNNCLSVYNNVIWSLGEISMRSTYDEIKPYLKNFIDLLIPIMNNTNNIQTVLENTAICLGRMGLNDGAKEIAPRLHEFILQWCSQILYLMDNDKKKTAYQGILNIINYNPDHGFGGLVTQNGKKNLTLFIICIGNYLNAPDFLLELFSQLINSYMKMLGNDVWQNQILSDIDPDTLNHLKSFYDI